MEEEHHVEEGSVEPAIESPAPKALSPIDRVVQQYNAQRRAVSVPEWDGMVLYFGPLTSADIDGVDSRMRALHGEDPQKWPTQARRVLTLIQKAELENGAQAFHFGDQHALMNRVPFGVLARLVTEMYAVGMGLEEAEKKSTPPQTFDSV